MTSKNKIICNVCGKEKKPYFILIKNEILSFLRYKSAREKGEICKRCNQYHAMTGELKDATVEEFKLAVRSVDFAGAMMQWWEKDKRIVVINDDDNPVLTDIEATRNENKRIWEGKEEIARWYRTKMRKWWSKY